MFSLQITLAGSPKPLFFRKGLLPTKQIARADAIQARSVPGAIEHIQSCLTGKATIQVVDSKGEVTATHEVDCQAPAKQERAPRGSKIGEKVSKQEAFIARMEERAKYHTERAAHFQGRADAVKTRMAAPAEAAAV